MVNEFDKYILDFSIDDFDEDYWYDEGVNIAESMLYKFSYDDWKILLEIIPFRSVEWQKRLAYCMHDRNNFNELEVLLELVETKDSDLFEIVVDSLRGFTSDECSELIHNNSQLNLKINELMPKAGVTTKKIFEDFLKY